MSKLIPKLALCIAVVSASGIVACKDTDNGTLRLARPKDAGTERDASDASTDSVERFVGSVEDTDVRVGAVIGEDPERARIFFCGGPETYATLTQWILVDVAANGDIVFEDDAVSVHAKLTGEKLEGKFEKSGELHDFNAAKVASKTIAGLYEGLSDCGRVGLIVTQASSNDEPEGQGACVSMNHPPEQVNPILPVALSGGEIKVTIGDTEASVSEAGLSAR
jgi:hypothetical protein